MSVAYYDTFTGRARYSFPGAAHPVVFVPYSAAGEYDGLTITVSAGADAQHCDLTVTLPAPGLQTTETWKALPRDPEAFAAVLAGTAQPTGQNSAYDYAKNAHTTLPGASLIGGSRLIAVDVRGASGDVDLGTATLLNAPPSAQWYGSLPGTTLRFDGDATVAGQLDRTAVRLDGVHDGITLGNPDRLAITGQITLEAWVRPTAKDGLRDVVSHGYHRDPDGEVFLRINDGAYQTGSWNGTDHAVSVPMPETDLNSWVHLAGTYDDTRWSLYRNGVLAGQTEDTVGAVAVDAAWTVGVSAEVDLDLSAKLGAHLELEVEKHSDTDTDFTVDIDLDPERDISEVDSQDKRIPMPGKVDAYRFMTFYLRPDSDHHDLFFNQVVDPIWLAQSDDPNAVALRGARQATARPPCWRVLHRVTFVSRILAPVSPQGDPYTQALRSLDIESNYELIKTLEPYVTGHTASYGDFATAVEKAVARRLPDLGGHLTEVTTYLAQYYGVVGS